MMSHKEKEADIRRLASICLEDRELTDAELEEIFKLKDGIERFLSERARFVAFGVLRVKHVRSRMMELADWPTEQIERRLDRINAETGRVLAADTYDGFADVFFDPSPIDSERNILQLMLVARKKKTRDT